MLTVIALFGVLIILASAYGSASPQGLLVALDKFSGRAGFVFAIAVRIVLGGACFAAAAGSLWPAFLQVIGAISLLAAVVLAVIGLAGYRRIIAWVSGMAPAMIRLWLLFGLVFGAALVWVSGVV